MSLLNNLQTLQTTLSRRQRLIALAIVAVLVFGLLAATVFRSQAATAIRFITYDEGKDDFSHNAQSNSLFLGMGNDLLVCTQSQVQVFSPMGELELKQSVSMTSPSLNAAGDYAVVYDVGHQEVVVVHGTKLVTTMELPSEESLICATVNEKGWVAVTSKVSGYKAVVTVYNPDFESVLSIKLSSRYISDAVVTPDCRGVYLVSPGQAGGSFENTLLYYTMSSREEPTKTLSLGANVVLSILSGDKCWILGNESLLILDSSCVVTASYDYQGQYLKMGTLQGDGFAALFLSRSSSGSAGSLVTVNDNGDEIGRLTLEGQTAALAAQGNKVALLTTGEILTANAKLHKYRTEPNQRGIRNLAVYDDGSVALVSSATVGLYFPSGAQILNEEETEEAEEVQLPEETQDAAPGEDAQSPAEAVDTSEEAAGTTEEAAQ